MKWVFNKIKSYCLDVNSLCLFAVFMVMTSTGFALNAKHQATFVVAATPQQLRTDSPLTNCPETCTKMAATKVKNCRAKYHETCYTQTQQGGTRTPEQFYCDRILARCEKLATSAVNTCMRTCAK